MTQDHLGNEAAISAKLTEAGLKASVNSRAVSAIDRLVGNVSTLGDGWLEGVITRRRAQVVDERKLREAVAAYGIRQVGAHDAFATRAFENHYKKIAQQQVNKDAVVAETLEDLRQNAPNDEESVSGPERVSDEFMDRFGYYAESASTEELRQRWGRVLSSEIRKPGTFGAKALRAADELDIDTARLLERLAANRVRPSAISRGLSGELSHSDQLALVSAGLIAEPGPTGHSSHCTEAELENGEKVWVFGTGPFAFGFSKTSSVTYSADGPLTDNNGQPGIPAYILTEVGKALAGIFAVDHTTVFTRLLAYIRTSIPDDDLLCFHLQADGSVVTVPPDAFELKHQA
jgi:hypothetical protein